MGKVKNFKFGLYVKSSKFQPADVVIPKWGVVRVTRHIL